MSSALQALFGGINRIRLGMVLLPDRDHRGRPNVRAPERDELIAMISVMIERRRAEPPVGDLLDLLIQARDPERPCGYTRPAFCSRASPVATLWWPDIGCGRVSR